MQDNGKLGSQEKILRSPSSPLSWATRVALNFRTLKKRKMTSSFLPELCLHRGDVCTLVDMKGRPHTGLLCSVEENPPYPFHPSLPGPWAQLWPGKGEAMRTKTMPFIFLPMSYRPYIPNTRKLKKTVTPTRETVAGAVKNWR